MSRLIQQKSLTSVEKSLLISTLDLVNKGNISQAKEVKKQIQKIIANDLGVNKDFNPETEFNNRKDFLKSVLLESGTKTLVLGVSGGVDSLTASLMCQKAVEELRATTKDDSYGFIAVKLPYKTQKDAEFVELSLDTIKPDVIEIINIGDTVDQMQSALTGAYTTVQKNEAEQDFVKGNIKARARMIAQYALANIYNGLVVGTDHAAEAVSGFFTKFGDGACDVTPLSGLVKQQVRDIAKSQGAPKELYAKVATADLEDLDVNKPDEEALGVSYEDIDNFLLGQEVSDKVFNTIFKRYVLTEHKRQQPISLV